MDEKRVKCVKKMGLGGTWVAQMVKRLPSAQGRIPASWDQPLGQTPCSSGSLLLPLPLPLPPLLMLSLCLK